MLGDRPEPTVSNRPPVWECSWVELGSVVDDKRYRVKNYCHRVGASTIEPDTGLRTTGHCIVDLEIALESSGSR